MDPSLAPYVVVLLAAGASTTALSVVGWRYRTTLGADWFTAMMVLQTVWVALSIGTLLVDDDGFLIAIDVFATVIALSVPVMWFVFLLEYTGRGHLITARSLAALWAIPLASFLAILTEPLHDLYFAAVEPVETAGLTVVETPPGPVAVVALLYVLALFLAGLRLVVGMLSEHDRLFSGQGLWLFLGTLAPVAVGVAQAVGALPEGLPLVPAGLSITGLAYGYSLFHHRLFDLSPAARRIGADEALDDLEEGVIVVDRDADVVAINESACEQFDCERTAVLGRSLEAVSPAVVDVPAEGARDVTRNSRVLEVSRSAVRDTRDRPTGYALVVRDVTAQRGRKQRLEVLNRILRHNLRNDMTIVQGYASELADGEAADDAAAEMAAAVEETAADLMGLAEKARDIERTITTEEADRRPVELVSMLQDVVHSMERAYPGRTVDVSVPEDLTVVTDAPTLELVVRNLVENAVEHGSTNPRSSPREDAVEHGSTKPDSQAPPEEPTAPEAPGEFAPVDPDEDGVDVEIRVRCVAEGIEIAVSDDGPGIPQSELDVIERGTETDLDHCSGLGLWLVRWGATRLGADLRFETRDGTTVRLTLPEP